MQRSSHFRRIKFLHDRSVRGEYCSHSTREWISSCLQVRDLSIRYQNWDLGMIYYSDPHSPDRFTQLLLPSSLKRRAEGARRTEELRVELITRIKVSWNRLFARRAIVMRFLYEQSVATMNRGSGRRY